MVNVGCGASAVGVVSVVSFDSSPSVSRIPSIASVDAVVTLEMVFLRPPFMRPKKVLLELCEGEKMAIWSKSAQGCTCCFTCDSTREGGTSLLGRGFRGDERGEGLVLAQ